MFLGADDSSPTIVDCGTIETLVYRRSLRRGYNVAQWGKGAGAIAET